MSLSNKPGDFTLRLTSKLSTGPVIVGDSYFTSLHSSISLVNERNPKFLQTVPGVSLFF